MKRRVALLVLTALLLTGCASQPELPKEQWITEEGKTYYYDAAGEKATGWQTVGGKRYYFAGDGAMATGWQTIDGARYCLAEDGVLLTGRQNVDGTVYYLDENGAALTGYQVIRENGYLLDENGVILTGWQTAGDKTYYLGQSGVARLGWQVIDGEKYYFGENGAMYTGWKTIGSDTYYFGDDGILYSGWLDVEGRRYYLSGGQKTTGWKTVDGDTYYFNPDGTVYTGWLEQGEDMYYFLEDGVMAIGEVEIQGESRFFLANGKHFYLVNPWHYIPEDYEADIVKYNGRKMDSSCVEPLKQMLKDCKAAGHGVMVVSTYRTNAQQTYLHNRMIKRYLGYGYGEAAAKKKASTISAVPGTSEHQLGLAFDIVDSAYTKLNYQQAEMPTQKWLMENSWKYGFNLRYPTGKSKITGIIYEPWHYRYVGVELAKELYERDICLEEYFAQLTQQEAAKREAKAQQ